ncbi:transcriptional activator, TenA family protein [Cutaneotrichosporon oleaginosum]|uniref:Transcriptional activator, TenA family protein n=1 Tax=Cutaneotrichosporon oleaginosum TaxID=879819 RepID=A0A0J1AY08_9TREE|nr:transcriptional activator, TenA family protein [Cutaneotrichosporon oleaginosum]KLT40214.1 transcriptional activator, TenA family protein [Cutaneotrichosporon oleaginosum]TXT10496.1 hypothetical protein COLE_04430 [Cutaneotrichosporon oleaginosum]
MASYANELRAAHEQTWKAATTHRFVRELWADTLPASVMHRYLSQDYLFCDTFVALMGSAVSNSDNPGVRLSVARQLGFVAGDEDDFFRRALSSLDHSFKPTTSISVAPHALEVPSGHHAYSPLPVTAGLLAVMDEARASYAAAITVLLVAEWVYLDWATSHPASMMPKEWTNAKWIELHSGPAFEAWVELLRNEFDRVAVQGGNKVKVEMETFFARTIKLELEFFNAAYEK